MFTELQATLKANRQYRARIRRNIGGSSKGWEYEIWVENAAGARWSPTSEPVSTLFVNKVSPGDLEKHQPY
jgi:hypothetical protein